MRLSIKKVANGWEVRIPLGDPNGEAIPISIEDLKPKLNPNYGNKYLHKDKIDRRRYLNPVEGPVGFQILEAAYIKLMSAKNGMTYGPLDRSVIDNGGKSTKAVKKLLGDGIDIEVIGKNEYDSTLGTQGEGVSHDVLEYLINFVPSKDMTTVSSKTTRDKSDHDKSFVEGGIQFAYNHAYSLLSVDVVRPKEQGGQVSVRGVRLVNPWDNSQTIYVPIDIFMASFRCLEVGEVNVGQMYQ